MHSFIFNGKMSSEFDTDVTNVIIQKSGKRQRPIEQIDIYEIPYRNENLVIHSGKYKSYIQEFEMMVRDAQQIPRINTWLSGRGKLILEKDIMKYYRCGFYYASVIEGWEYEKINNSNDIYTFKVKFQVDPFFYYDGGQKKKIYANTPLTIINFGNIYSEPYIKINGSGDISLTVNDQICNFTNIQDYIEIDSSLMVAYKDTLNQGNKMYGDFPVFPVGKVEISWTGNVSSVEIKTRERDLG